MSKRALGIVAILLLILLGFSAVLNLGLMLAAPFRGLAVAEGPEPLREMVVQGGDPSAKIARIDIEGMITNFEGGFWGNPVTETKQMLGAAVNDPLVKAIVLRINSPGGEITASDILYQAVKEAAAIKPVVAYFDSVGASGGYYVACGASSILANETTLTGSIGVIIQTLNYEELLGKVGLETVVFTSGEFKDMLSPSREMRPEERVYVQAMVEEMYQRFLGIVAVARDLPVESLREGVADGRVLTGRAALAAGLIDGTGYVEDAYARAAELAGLGVGVGAQVVRYGRDVSLLGLLSLMGQASGVGEEVTRVRLEFGERHFPRLQPGALYLLPAHFAH